MTAREPLNMPLEEAMRTQRAIRRLRPDPVDDALVLHLIERRAQGADRLERAELGIYLG